MTSTRSFALKNLENKNRCYRGGGSRFTYSESLFVLGDRLSCTFFMYSVIVYPL